MLILVIMLSMFFARLIFLKISIKNEKSILANGGKEFGKVNSQALTLLHILIYLFATSEAIVKQTSFDKWSFFGLCLMVFSLIVLYWVTQLLEGIWTVKLMLAKDHKFVDHWIFHYVKHPNYFLNIFPELLGIILLCHAKITASILLPFYIITIVIRIREENRLIKEVIIPNGYIKKENSRLLSLMDK